MFEKFKNKEKEVKNEGNNKEELLEEKLVDVSGGAKKHPEPPSPVVSK